MAFTFFIDVEKKKCYTKQEGLYLLKNKAGGSGQKPACGGRAPAGLGECGLSPRTGGQTDTERG